MYRHGNEEVEKVSEIVASGSWFRYYGTDKHCKATTELEQKLKDYTKAEYVLATSSCTGALISSLAAMGVGPQDEVIVPAYTFIATAAAVIAAGAVPVIAEIDETLTMDPEDVRRKISERTKVIIPVHMLGYPCNMDVIMTIAREHNLKVLEDSAQAVGAHYKGKVLGTIGDIGCYSFQWHKPISTGEGGCVLTNKYDLYDRAAIYHDDAHCFRVIEKGIPSFPGVNYRMSEIAAAVGLAQMDRLSGIVADLRCVKKNIIEQLGNLGDFRIAPSNDQEGDAGVVLTIQAPTIKAAEQFQEKTGLATVFDSNSTNWHICYHWDYILEKRSASGTGFPWTVGDWESPVQYSKDMCPNTIDILSRSFNYRFNTDVTEAEVKELVSSIRKGL